MSSTVDSAVEFHGFALKDPKGKFEPWSYHPRPLGDDDVEVSITHCGICASDLHTCFGGWGECHYPIIVGHEIVGTARAVGKNVKDIKVGDRIGCGAQCEACYNRKKDCSICEHGHEQYCDKGSVNTYNSKYPDGEYAQGGYADAKRFHSKHAFHIPENISSAEAAPLLCAGATVYTPLALYKAGPGKKVGIIGIGGLGHLAVQFAAKMGAETIAIGTSPSKRDLAINKLGATDFVNINDEEQVKKYAKQLDLIICTANAKSMDWAKYLNFAKSVTGVFVLVALPEEDIQLNPFAIVVRGVQFAGSCIGSLNEIKEMLAFASKHDVRPIIELMPMSQVNEGIKKVQDNQVRFRVVLEQGK